MYFFLPLMWLGLSCPSRKPGPGEPPPPGGFPRRVLGGRAPGLAAAELRPISTPSPWRKDSEGAGTRARAWRGPWGGSSFQAPLPPCGGQARTDRGAVMATAGETAYACGLPDRDGNSRGPRTAGFVGFPLQPGCAGQRPLPASKPQGLIQTPLRQTASQRVPARPSSIVRSRRGEGRRLWRLQGGLGRPVANSWPTVQVGVPPPCQGASLVTNKS